MEKSYWNRSYTHGTFWPCWSSKFERGFLVLVLLVIQARAYSLLDWNEADDNTSVMDYICIPEFTGKEVSIPCAITRSHAADDVEDSDDNNTRGQCE